MKNFQTGVSRIAKNYSILLTLMFLSFRLSAQTPITGKIYDNSGQPLTGATVMIKGANKGTTTNAQGEFSLAAKPDETLVISMVGYQPISVKVGTNKTFNLQLRLQTGTIDEVIVVGYGTQKRGNITGAVSRVDSKTITQYPTVSVSDALQGRVPGLQVVANGSPGTEPLVSIRGISSINYSTTPLYVIDGFPTGDLASFDTRDVESVDVLKDASSAAIYGSRATNGVIIITTKKGRKSGDIHVNLSTSVGMQNFTKRLSLLNPEQFDEFATAYRGSLVPRRMAPWLTTPIYQGASATYGDNVTDWQDAYFKNGPMTQTNINISGGNDVSHFYASGGYYNQEGVTPTVGFKRYNFRINSEHNISKVFAFGENLYLAYSNQAYDNNETGQRSNLVNVIKMMPYMPVHDPTTSDGFRGVNSVLDGGDPTNPIEDPTVKNPGNRTTTKILGTVYGDINFTSWLKFRSVFGIDYSNSLDYRFSPIFNDSGTVAGSSALLATITNNRAISSTQLFTEQLTFDKTYGSHHINATAIYEYQGQTINQENANGQQPSNSLTTLNNAGNTFVQTLVYNNNIISYIGRINYDFQGKYLLSGTIRRDGLSIWAPGRKWETFPSISAGWKIDQENFMKNLTIISELKVRGGYGVTGLNGTVLGSTPWLVSVSANSAYYPFANTISEGPASSIQGLGNTSLQWEITKQTDVGLDLGLWNNAVTFSADYYHRNTPNLILAVPLPPSAGYLNSNVNSNVGGMTNDGFEFQLGYFQRHGAFQWNALANFSTVHNNVYALSPGVTNIEAGADGDQTEGYNVTNTAPGHPVQSFYGWQTDGIFQDAGSVAKSAFQTAATAPGDIKFKDLDGNDTINNKDRTYLGSFIPNFTYSLNLGATYKNFGLSIFLQGVEGNKIYNTLRGTSEGMVRFFNASTRVLDAWTPSNTNTDVPRAISSDPNQNARTSNRFLEDGSYLRLKNIMLSYTIPDKSLASMTKGVVKGFTIYISSQNLLTFTKYTGYDPEVGNLNVSSSTLTSGIDYAVYPQPKAYQIGVNVNF